MFNSIYQFPLPLSHKHTRTVTCDRTADRHSKQVLRSNSLARGQGAAPIGGGLPVPLKLICFPAPFLRQLGPIIISTARFDYDS